jgi:hypothetical protein
LLALVVYLLFFNQGFELSPAIETTDTGLGIYVSNSSVHEISDITIKYLDASGQQAFIKAIERLAPGEQALIELAPDHVVEDYVTIYASSPYHPLILRSYPLGGLSFVRLQPAIIASSTAPLGSTTQVLLELCNEGMALENVRIEPSVSNSNLESLTASRTFSLARDQCLQPGFDFRANKLGSSTIYFKVNALSYSKEISYTIRVVEGAS